MFLTCDFYKKKTSPALSNSCFPTKMMQVLVVDVLRQYITLWVRDGSQFLFSQFGCCFIVISKIKLGTYQNDGSVGAVMRYLWEPLKQNPNNYTACRQEKMAWWWQDANEVRLSPGFGRYRFGSSLIDSTFTTKLVWRKWNCCFGTCCGTITYNQRNSK